MGSQLGKQQKEEINKLVERLSITPEDRKYTEDTFRKFCRFGRKTMSRDDFIDFLAMMNIQNYSELLISCIFQVLDTNADGELSAVEFIRYFILLTRFPVETKVQIVFDIVDRDSSGLIELLEIRRFYYDLVNSRAYLIGGSGNYAGEDVDRLFDVMDANSNKLVDANEFQLYARQHGTLLLELLDAYLGE